MQNSSWLSRRRFLQNAGMAAAAWAAPSVIPGSVLGAEGTTPPSERITVGMIGVGRQAKFRNIPQFLKMKDVQIVAVCDVDAWRLAEGKKQVEEAYAKKKPGNNYKGVDAYKDFYDILGRKDIQAVMISTPDHWHTPIALESLKAGKDVSLEKPITRSIGEGKRLVEAVAKYKQVFRVDSELRSYKHIIRATELIRNGAIGKVQKVTVSIPVMDEGCAPQPDMPVPPELDYELWQGPAPRAPYTMFRVHKPKAFDRGGWMRHSYYSDGVITNWTTHWNDGAAFAAGLDTTGPVEIEGTGTYPAVNSFWNVLIKLHVNMRFANGVEWTYSNDENKPYYKIEGTEGWIYADYKKVEASKPSILTATIPENGVRFYVKSDKQDFIDCVKSRKENLEPVDVGHRITSMGHLGHIAIHLGRKLKWNPVKEQFIGDDEANAMLEKPINDRPKAKA